MKIFHSIPSLKTELRKFHNQKIGLVPTMGFLHDGHLSLMQQCKESCDVVVATIFVNKKQFNNSSDYLLYPRNIEQDIKKISNLVDILFCPTTEEIYPEDFFTTISISTITQHLCGKFRTGHFDAVGLIVTKLLNIIKPQQAFFGEKDFQQLQVIKRLVKDLSIDTSIIAGKTARQSNGLAMSSRNSRLSDCGKEIAAQIYYNLCLTRDKILNNYSIAESIEDAYHNFSLLGLKSVEYLQCCNEETLTPITHFSQEIKSRLFIAIYVEEVRLIDNIAI